MTTDELRRARQLVAAVRRGAYVLEDEGSGRGFGRPERGAERHTVVHMFIESRAFGNAVSHEEFE